MKKCEECGGELKPKIEFYGKDHFKKLQKSFKKKFKEELQEPKGYNCIVCGLCYDENFKKENHSIGWLK